MQLTPHPPPAPPPLPADRPDLRTAATELEASFLAEMLKSAGFGQPREGPGGGTGEDQFAGLLVREQARAFARSGGIGLAESIYRALLRGPDA